MCVCMYIWAFAVQTYVFVGFVCMHGVCRWVLCVYMCMSCVCIYTRACMSGFAYVHMCGRVLCNYGGAFCGFVPVCVCMQCVSVFCVHMCQYMFV